MLAAISAGNAGMPAVNAESSAKGVLMGLLGGGFGGLRSTVPILFYVTRAGLYIGSQSMIQRSKTTL